MKNLTAKIYISAAMALLMFLAFYPVEKPPTYRALRIWTPAPDWVDPDFKVLGVQSEVFGPRG